MVQTWRAAASAQEQPQQLEPAEDALRSQLTRASLLAQRLKRLPGMRGTRVRSLGREDPLEKEMATHSSIHAWRILDRGAWWDTVHGIAELDTTE